VPIDRVLLKDGSTPCTQAIASRRKSLPNRPGREFVELAAQFADRFVNTEPASLLPERAFELQDLVGSVSFVPMCLNVCWMPSQ